jgi:ATPase subunit of ABC transporter with duplicated ATPase domains
MNRFEAYAAEPRDYIEADEERARNERARELAREARSADIQDEIDRELADRKALDEALPATDLHTRIRKPPRKPRQARYAKQQPAPRPAPPAPEKSDLDARVEALVAQYGNGAVIDASWAAAHRLFKPAA